VFDESGDIPLRSVGEQKREDFPKTALYSFSYLLYAKEEKKNYTQKRKRGHKGKERATEEDARMR